MSITRMEPPKGSPELLKSQQPSCAPSIPEYQDFQSGPLLCKRLMAEREIEIEFTSNEILLIGKCLYHTVVAPSAPIDLPIGMTRDEFKAFSRQVLIAVSMLYDEGNRRGVDEWDYAHNRLAAIEHIATELTKPKEAKPEPRIINVRIDPNGKPKEALVLSGLPESIVTALKEIFKPVQ